MLYKYTNRHSSALLYLPLHAPTHFTVLRLTPQYRISCFSTSKQSKCYWHFSTLHYTHLATLTCPRSPLLYCFMPHDTISQASALPIFQVLLTHKQSPPLPLHSLSTVLLHGQKHHLQAQALSSLPSTIFTPLQSPAYHSILHTLSTVLQVPALPIIKAKTLP